MMRLWWIELLFVCWVCSANALEAGAAKVDITPSTGIPLCGDWTRLGRVAESVHDPIWARALYLKTDETALCWVTTDLWAVSEELRLRVLELAPSETPRENIILSATHTQNGPGGMMRPLPHRIIAGRFTPKLIEFTAQGIAEAIRSAVAVRKAASIGFATAEQADLSVNRHAPDGPRDPQLGVIRVEDADGNLIAIVTNLAAQPGIAGRENALAISADFPGAYYQQLEQSAPGCIAMFLLGAAGNQDAANPEKKSGWDRVESFGRLLAERACELAARTSCGDAKLRLTTVESPLPQTMAAGLLPEHARLCALEIGGLLVTFFPGDACVELGNEVRQMALDATYAAQFSVNAANGYFGCFSPPEYYAQSCIESWTNFYGPGISVRLLREFSKLVQGERAQDTGRALISGVESIDGINRLTLSGTFHEIGRQRGMLFAEMSRQRYETGYAAPARSGELLPAHPAWNALAACFDVSTYALPVLGISGRRSLQGLSNSFLEELDGMAAGAELPFDAFWLTQQYGDASTESPRSNMAASMGDRAGVDGLFVGHVVYEAGPGSEELLVLQERLTSGRAILQITSPSHAGTFSGMSDSGLVVCAERAPALGTAGSTAPVEFLLHDLLHRAKSAQQAIDFLQMRPGIQGYRVLIADAAEPTAVIVECGATIQVRKPEKGLLFSGEAVAPAPGSESGPVPRLAGILRREHLVGSAKLRNALTDRAEPDPVWKETTRYAVVFEPKTGTIQICLPKGDGAPGKFVSIGFEGAAP